jgi:hypothetical protein
MVEYTGTSRSLARSFRDPAVKLPFAGHPSRDSATAQYVAAAASML